MSKIDRLANQALQLKKAFLMAIAIANLGDKISQTDYIIPAYQTWRNKELKRHIQDLEDDFNVIAKIIFLNWKPGLSYKKLKTRKQRVIFLILLTRKITLCNLVRKIIGVSLRNYKKRKAWIYEIREANDTI